MPASLPAPVAAVAVTTPGTGTLSAGTYFVEVTQWNQWGETLPSTESGQQTVLATNGIQITSALQVGATKIRAYLTQVNGSSGTESQYVESTTSPFTILTNPVLAGSPPVRGTAWLPDSDGGFISAGAIYRWLNAGIELIARGTGGIQDYSAIGSTINQPLYQIPGTWNSITAIWYDGYWMQGGDAGTFWRRNSITSQVLSQAHISVNSGKVILEVYPQPDRTSVNTTLASPMLATDTTATLTNAGFTLPFGFVSIGSEIMAYATISGSNLTGLIRGLGGTSAIAHSSMEVAIECNIAWMGKRQSNQVYSPGQSTTILPLTSGWDQLLVQYISGRAKIVEHDMQTLQAFNADMEKSIKGWAKTNAGVVRRRQVGGPSGPVVYYPDLGGGLLINALTPFITFICNPLEHISRMYYKGHGGIHPCLTLFMFCATLVPVMLSTWEKLKTHILERRLIHHLRKYEDKESVRSNGRWNSFLSVFGLNLKSSKSAKTENGRSGRNFGLLITDSPISSTSVPMQLLEISMRAVKTQKRNCVVVLFDNFLTLFAGKSTKRPCSDGLKT